MTYPINFNTEVASYYHATSNHHTYELFQFKKSHITGLVTILFCTLLNSAFFIFRNIGSTESIQNNSGGLVEIGRIPRRLWMKSQNIVCLQSTLSCR